MRWLIDEDVPVKLLRILTTAGHDAIRVTAATPDAAIANQARAEDRILVTLDSDFTNQALYPPERFSILHIRLHPPNADAIVTAVMGLLASTKSLKGLTLLGRTGAIRIVG